MSFRPPTQSTILSKLTVNLVLPYHSVLAAKEVSMGCLKNRSHSTKFLTNFGIQLAILKLSSLFPSNLKYVFSEQPTNAAASSTITGEDAPVRKEKPTRKARTVARLINTKPCRSKPQHGSKPLLPRKSNYTVPLTDKFFNSLIRSYGDAGLLQESMKVFKVMKSMVISPSAVTFNSLFLILLKRGRVAMVFELYDEMLRTYGVKPDLYTFNILIRGFCVNSMVDEAFRMFKEMERFECEPDLITYNTIVDGLCRAGKVNVARNVVNGMRKKSLRPNVVSYTTLIRGFCAKQEIDGAMDVFREMENLDEALKVFEKMKEMNVKQDSATYSMLIRTLCRKMKFDKAEELLDELFEQEILLRNDNTTPLAAAYNPIFEYLCTSGKTKKREFRQLMKRGLQDPHAFETLIMGIVKKGLLWLGISS
ncbi:Pentatricopeptide repeat-containing protein, chloroplastic [Sesamum angolense]|uniref:Pentatricopeptide repeat-containing protein, chloroplastic n=1 Tax=Sesamum angolense TaxID=2727404 RepID=A0AAE1W1X4_9LAMI|nr:Pentatricopeptide repeat-containing protein, chloroplastic [Sesamum angolense]